MSSGIEGFLSRARLFLSHLAAGEYPNSRSLAKASDCSQNTAQRTIYRLRDEYLIPIEYDTSKKGYYLQGEDIQSLSTLPPGRDAVLGVFLAKEIMRSLDSSELQSKLDSLWSYYANSNSAIIREFEPLSSILSVYSDALGHIRDKNLFSYIEAAIVGEGVFLKYSPPWRMEPFEGRGRIQRVIYLDGSFYLLFDSDSGLLALDSSYISEFSGGKTIGASQVTNVEDLDSGSWLSSFGVWESDVTESLEIEVLPPMSKAVAHQSWHIDQEDTWSGLVLNRRIVAPISSSLVRRVLSLGRHVGKVRPQTFRAAVRKDASILLGTLSENNPDIQEQRL